MKLTPCFDVLVAPHMWQISGAFHCLRVCHRLMCHSNLLAKSVRQQGCFGQLVVLLQPTVPSVVSDAGLAVMEHMAHLATKACDLTACNLDFGFRV